MATDILKRIRLVYRRSSQLTKTVVLCAVVLSMAALLALNLTMGAMQKQTQELTGQAAALEQANDQLEEDIDALGSADSVEKIAEEALGLVDPDTVIIEPEE